MTPTARLALLTIRGSFPNCAEVLRAELELADNMFDSIITCEPNTTAEDIVCLAKTWPMEDK